jgi:hypothetical protein
MGVYAIAVNLFHIIFVTALLVMLVMNLKDGNDTLKRVTYGVIAAMIGFHSFRIWSRK